MSDRLWALAQMLLARRGLTRVEDIGFWKLFGSGIGEGFTPLPNVSVYAILATWPGTGIARRRIDEAPVFRRYRARASESWTIFLDPISARGFWSGQCPFTPEVSTSPGPLAALTRASVRPRVLSRFWGRVPNISRRIGKDPNVMFRIGVGEVPWLHQVTFSIWPDEASMAAFARRGCHAEAIRAVRAEGWFSEELYARFRVTGEMGSWGGIAPLVPARTELAQP